MNRRKFLTTAACLPAVGLINTESLARTTPDIFGRAIDTICRDILTIRENFYFRINEKVTTVKYYYKSSYKYAQCLWTVGKEYHQPSLDEIDAAIQRIWQAVIGADRREFRTILPFDERGWVQFPVYFAVTGPTKLLLGVETNGSARWAKLEYFNCGLAKVECFAEEPVV
jgi:hypothetical protein